MKLLRLMFLTNKYLSINYMSFNNILQTTKIEILELFNIEPNELKGDFQKLYYLIIAFENKKFIKNNNIKKFNSFITNNNNIDRVGKFNDILINLLKQLNLINNNNTNRINFIRILELSFSSKIKFLFNREKIMGLKVAKSLANNNYNQNGGKKIKK